MTDLLTAPSRFGWGPPQLLAERASEECGCPEQEWQIEGFSVVLHFEPDGTIEAFLDNGDWDTTIAPVPGATTLEQAVAHVRSFIEGLPEG